ncbi:hypothetical protein EHP00_426 [Ecytonucleospora hepatopenaei]|uniref:Uncharacterized protein n=1 Tax=Ecytonucleospora hepatopenaei TaxID=646526 RepID=A0A1W0E617_9MICR|nr:hypothetical protein EHP00_426 [Ecytonucleospora hepatopenaei]
MSYNEIDESISNEMLFNDLPENIKRQFVELRNLSQKKYTFGMSHPLKNTCENISVPECQKFYEQFGKYVTIFNDLNTTHVEINQDFFQKELEEFTRFKNIYTNNLLNKDIVGEMETVVKMMEKKYEEIKLNTIKKF